MKLAIIFLTVAVATCFGQSNNAQWGQFNFNHTVSYIRYFDIPSGVLSVIDEYIVFPEPGHVSFMPITAIFAFDQHTNGNGANATIIEGGINNTTVTLRLRSQRGHRINFQVEIYTVDRCNPQWPAPIPIASQVPKSQVPIAPY